LSAIQGVIHFDGSVIARDVTRDIRAPIAFQLVLVDESTGPGAMESTSLANSRMISPTRKLLLPGEK
jgi:hypothetical protein